MEQLMKHFFFMIGLLCTLSGMSTPVVAESDIILTGAGATFPQPLYEKWISEYQARTGVKISYLSGGSGKGIMHLLDRAVDFGATDAFMSEEELQKAPGSILHIPTCIGAVTIIYNLPGFFSLKLTPDVLTDIFSGIIRNWSDSRIAAINKETSLPDYDITIVHRSEESGTTYILTDYFSKVNTAWDKMIGKGKQIRWPTGIGVESNQGVAETVKKIPGSIGYVELTYAKKHSLPLALIRNKSGNFILPTLESVSKAADVNIPQDTRIFISNTEAPEGYPISAFTWLILYQNQDYNNRSRAQATELSEFLWWAIHDGQSYNNALFYAVLPESAIRRSEFIIRSMTFGATPLFEN